jgi:hypothetical protein
MRLYAPDLATFQEKEMAPEADVLLRVPEGQAVHQRAARL